MTSIFDVLRSAPRGDVCPGSGERPQRMIVAVGHGASVLFATCGIVFDMQQFDVPLDDCLKLPDPPGLYVWEGVIQYDYDDVDYLGEFRALGSGELACVIEHNNPWPCSYCNGTGIVDVEVT